MKHESIMAICITIVMVAALAIFMTLVLKGCEQYHELEVKCIEKGMIMLPNHTCVSSKND